MKEGVPENAGDVFASGEQEAADILILLPVDGSRDEEIFDCERTRLAVRGENCDVVVSWTYGCRPAGERPVHHGGGPAEPPCSA